MEFEVVLWLYVLYVHSYKLADFDHTPKYNMFPNCYNQEESLVLFTSKCEIYFNCGNFDAGLQSMHSLHCSTEPTTNA